MSAPKQAGEGHPGGTGRGVEPGDPSGPTPGPPLALARQAALIARSLALQAAWSFERMQSVGFAAALAGEGRRLTKGAPDAARAFLERHLGYFNTNPAMASYLLGAAMKLEEAAAAGEPGALEALARFKRAAVTTLASWGDQLFWATLRPVATVFGVLVAWLLLRVGAGGGEASPFPALTPVAAAGWGAAAYLIVYNAAHLHYRVRGVGEGYRWGAAVAARVGRSPVRRLPGRLRAAGLLATGLLIPLAVLETRRGFGPFTAALGVLLAAALAVHLRRRAGLGWGWGVVVVAAGLLFRLAAAGR